MRSALATLARASRPSIRAAPRGAGRAAPRALASTMSTTGAPAPALIDLRKGHPLESELPHAALARACASAAADLASGEAGLALQYGHSRGTPAHLETLQRWLQERYGSPVRRGGLMTTNGVSHGLELCAACLTTPGDEIIVEQPTYVRRADDPQTGRDAAARRR